MPALPHGVPRPLAGYLPCGACGSTERKPGAEWGPILTIRTGPAAFSERLVTMLKRKGWGSRDGRVLNLRGEVVPCPEERDFFVACGEPLTEPEDRA